jgi:hypothetical protein
MSAVSSAVGTGLEGSQEVSGMPQEFNRNEAQSSIRTGHHRVAVGLYHSLHARCNTSAGADGSA